MTSINQCALIVASLNLLAYFYQCQGAATAAQSDSSPSFIAKVCASKLAEGQTIDAMNRLFLCDCTTNPSSNSSTVFKQITCAKRKLNNKYFDEYTLPDSVAVLSMAWNNFDVMPAFSGNRLTTLDMSHNDVTTIDNAHTFENVSNLIELDLSWNRIVTISDQAFHKFDKLKRLDISHNQLSRLATPMFAAPSALEVLILSNNERLSEQFNRHDFDLFAMVGVPTTLARLEVNEIDLDRLNLAKAVALTELFARYNRFNESAPFTATWPSALQLIDLSGNPFESIPPNFLARFGSIREVFLRRMPTLKRVEANAFANLTTLMSLDMEGSKMLVDFSADAFGGTIDVDANGNNISHSKYLERLNLRDAKIERLGSTLVNSLHHLKRFELYGNPLNCDCELRWLARFRLETSGRCNRPDVLNGTMIENLAARKITCLEWPNVVYVVLHAILLMSLIAMFAMPIWLIVMFIRPKRHREGRKIGASSPYARITIESNRAEDMYF